MEKENIIGLKVAAIENRKKILRMIFKAHSGHLGGSLSIIDILTAIYALDVDFAAQERSRVILSKGHAVPAQYAVLNSLGIVKDEELDTLRQINSRLQGHPCITKLKEIDATTGLLGQGLSQGIGMALAKKINGDNHRVYVIVGDGEMNEGQICEALMQSAHYSLDNLILIVDRNKLCLSGEVDKVMSIGDITSKIKAFGWNVQQIDGHNMEQIVNALHTAQIPLGKPNAIICNTIKGKGVSFMENQIQWHSATLSENQYKQALIELEQQERDVFQ